MYDSVPSYFKSHKCTAEIPSLKKCPKLEVTLYLRNVLLGSELNNFSNGYFEALAENFLPLQGLMENSKRRLC